MRFLLALLIAASAAAKEKAPDPRAEAKVHREKGLAAEEQGKDDQAAAEFKLAVQADPSDAVSQHELGKILFKQGDLPAAIARFQAAVKLDEKNATAWYNLAYASSKAQSFEQAAQAYQKYTQLSPDDPDGYFGLAESLRQSGKGKEAAAAYKVYVAKETRASEQKWVELSKQRIAELEQPSPSPSTTTSTSTKTSTPPSTSTSTSTTPTPTTPPPAINSAAQAAARSKLAEGDRAFNAKDFRAALFAYQDAMVADPKNTEALLKAGNAYSKLGHDDEAIEQWNHALQLDPQNTAARDAIAAARQRKAALGASAPPPLTSAPQVDEAGARTHYSAAVGLIHDRKYDEALIELNQSLTLKPGWVNALIARGSARVGLAKYDDAIADYTAAQKADPSLAAPLFGLAEAYRGLGQTEKAADLYRQFAASNAPDAQATLKQYALQNAQALSPK
jgi:tetratricopeptide (TPR) repeat protein